MKFGIPINRENLKLGLTQNLSSKRLAVMSPRHQSGLSELSQNNDLDLRLPMGLKKKKKKEAEEKEEERKIKREK